MKYFFSFLGVLIVCAAGGYGIYYFTNSVLNGALTAGLLLAGAILLFILAKRH